MAANSKMTVIYQNSTSVALHFSGSYKTAESFYFVQMIIIKAYNLSGDAYMSYPCDAAPSQDKKRQSYEQCNPFRGRSRVVTPCQTPSPTTAEPTYIDMSSKGSFDDGDQITVPDPEPWPEMSWDQLKLRLNWEDSMWKQCDSPTGQPRWSVLI